MLRRRFVGSGRRNGSLPDCSYARPFSGRSRLVYGQPDRMTSPMPDFRDMSRGVAAIYAAADEEQTLARVRREDEQG